ncbi:MAG: hypothetical protein GWN01_14930, partial [Nitrosopumilaceae archaeon]|nr:hypothetical protein [Nitrosopumilaceae archaeon]NIU02143.1 hypothetical protein [Nitrosopumilaceae archaeon]NIV66768.1 hypothetical protein [Nitrosopumilaceae archaeon]NIX62744.1 hypothetical protein [Nitrosopumilaceae archaeon]
MRKVILDILKKKHPIILRKPHSLDQAAEGILIGIIVFTIFSVGFISFYLVNQDDIDSRIIQNTRPMSPDQQLAQQYGVGDYGSDHAHAALAVFVYGEQLNFGLAQFQLSS